MRIRKSAAGAALLAALTIAALAFSMRSAPSASAHHLCPNTGSPNGPFNIETYEAADYRNLYALTLELAGSNKLFPEISAFAVPRMETGDRAAASTQTVDPAIPPVLLKAMAYLESGWAQASFSPLVDYGETGPVLSSHDCGYGIMQVTSGMQNISGVPSLDQAMIGSHYAFNIAKGARILADKWNMSPETRPIIGTRDPGLIENWYYSIWGYNGWAFQNHPLNPSYSISRGVYSCGPAGDGLGHDRSQYPYQEVVLGCVANPPARLGSPLWPAQEVHLPEMTDPKFAEPMKVENWNPCTYSGQCAAMDIPTPNTNHRDPTAITLSRDEVIGVPSMDVSATTLSLTAQSASASANFSVLNSGSGVLGYRASSNASWLKVSPAAGVALGSDLGTKNGTVTLNANAASLAPGSHTAQVKVDSLYGGSRTVEVTLTIAVTDGSLVRGSGPDVYVVNRGLRRHVVDLANFLARGYSFSNVRQVADSYLNTIPRGRPLLDVFATGALVKGSAPDIWVMDGGAKRHAVSAERFLNCGYQWEAVTDVPDGLLDWFPSGSPIAANDCPKRGFSDGTLLEGTAAGVWVIEGGMRRWTVSADMFLSCGFAWGNVNEVPTGVITAIPQGPPLAGCYPEGALLRGSAPDVYVMHLGLKRHVIDLPNFLVRGYSFSNVRDISDGFLATMPTGQPLLDLFATGALVKGSAPDVYVIQSGSRRHAVNAETFFGCGYQFDAVVVVPDGILGSLPTGAPLSTTDCPRRSYSDGTLVEGSVAGVWLIQAGLRRWATSAEVFLSCGYEWGNVNQIADSSIAAISVGAPLSRC